MYSSDILPPDLFEQLMTVRQAYQPAYDVLWRNERLLRYVYWLEHGAHPTFNLVGSWTTDDINAEIELWELLRRQGADLGDAVEIIGAMQVERYGISLEAAIQRGSDPALADRHLPVWDLGTGSLVPQSLGPWLIYRVSNYEAESPCLGYGYHYGHPTERSTMSLYLYSSGQTDVAPGARDARVGRQFDQASRHIEMAAAERDCRFEWLMEPTMMTLQSSRDLPVHEIDRAGVATDAAGVRTWEAVAMTGFRGGFLKVRLTCHSEEFWNSEACLQAGQEVNTAIADFIVHFESKPTGHD